MAAAISGPFLSTLPLNLARILSLATSTTAFAKVKLAEMQEIIATINSEAMEHEKLYTKCVSLVADRLASTDNLTYADALQSDWSVVHTNKQNRKLKSTVKPITTTSVRITSTSDTKITSENIKLTVQKLVNPTDLGINVARSRVVKDAVVLDCETKAEASKLIDAVKNGSKDNLSADVIPLRSPWIKVCDVPQSTTDDIVMEKIIHTTNMSTFWETEPTAELTDIVLKHTQKVKTTTKRHLFLQVSPLISAVMIHRKKLSIDWENLNVYQHVPVTRCFQCLTFGHIKTECRKAETCSKCGGPHKFTECTETTLKCINCVNFNVTAKARKQKTIDVNHHVLDFNCAALRKQQDFVIARTVRGSFLSY